MEKIIEIQNITFCYPGAANNTLFDCSLSINKGEIITILGPNGAGKSTLLNCMCGLLSPNSGNVIINGKNIKKMTQKDIARIIGYVQQNQNSAFDHSVFDYVLMGRACNVELFKQPNQHDKDMVVNVLKQMQISHLADKAITEISGGERQQVAIARAIVQDPQVILFDEPTAHLDCGNQVRILCLILSLQKKGYSIIMTTHNPDHCMMLGSKVVILEKEGKLKIGNCQDMINNAELRKMYNTDFCVTYVDQVKRNVCIPLETKSDAERN